MNSALFQPLTLPCGSTVPNRIAKAAMEEGLAGAGQLPTAAHVSLYRRWAEGGTGLLITGNVMVDGRALTSPAAVVLQKGTPLDGFKAWADAGRSQGGQIWMQISHPGRQSGVAAGSHTWAPSDVTLALGRHSSMFKPPRAMTPAEVAETITRFADTAAAAEQAGFNGVQIHAAHGYLISQFLSPLTNRRTDEWGGSLANRARLLLDVVRAVRSRVSAGFAVAVKLNSADFQRGGFNEDDAAQVIAWLGELPVDLVELSGGSYEAPAMQGQSRDGRTLAREAFFLEFAEKLAQQARMPIMTTGGIRRQPVAEQVLASGVDMVGMGIALAVMPDLPRRWQAGDAAAEAPLPRISFKNKALASFAMMGVVRRHIHALARGDQAGQHYSALWTLITGQLESRKLARRYGEWVRGGMKA